VARIATSRGNSSGSEGAFRCWRLERPSFSTTQSSPVKTSPNGASIARQRAAVLSLARTWSADLKEQDIRINAVSPGVIDTPGYRLIGLDEAQLAGFFGRTADTAPIGRNGVPSDVAKVVAFLASDDSRFITGSEIFVDGGIAQS
jgi:NAD(P)-dependent dehydrogenase (short-subunit alcohol dehydrogenase family)